jgi:hypothetical protein
MIWLNPAALWALTLVAGVILVHLLRSRRARRLPFPSLRFVRPSRATSARLRLPSDWLLLLLRCALVAVAVLAVARPVALVRPRLDAWNARVARAVVLDSSASMRRAADPGPGGSSDAAALADAEATSAQFARRIETASLDEGLSTALAWLETAPPARQEVVVISDFHEGAFDSRALTAVPAHVGIRLLPAGALPPSAAIDGIALLDAPRQPSRRSRIELSQDGTRVVVVAAPGTRVGGLRIGARADQSEAIATLLQAVAEAGTPAPSAVEPIAVEFDGAPTVGGQAAPGAWMLQTIVRLADDEGLRRLAAHSTAASTIPATPGDIEILRDRRRQVLVAARANGPELVVRAAVDASSYEAARVLRAVLAARQGSLAQAEEEIRPIPPTLLASSTRAPGEAPPVSWRHAETSDSRWAWATVLLLLAIEQWARRPRGIDAAGTRDVAA